jgi:ribosomal protein S18 acetylase RimI-like enzyme
MATAAFIRSDPVGAGLHPFDPYHHMRGVAELVGSVFSDEMDARGRSMMREMEIVGRFSPILGGVLSMGFFEDFVSGYVWIENGKVVGNVTLQCADHVGSRWRLSNVAVAPAYRRSGIGRRLILASIREVAERGGSWTILQVRTDNPTAYGLYQKLGFSDVCVDGTWRLPVQHPPADRADPQAGLQRLRPTAWQARFELAQAGRSELAGWLGALPEADYRVDWGGWLGETLGKAIGVQQVERWGIARDGRLLGAVETWASGTGNPHRLRFAVRPAARGQMEAGLIARGLRSLAAAPPRPVVVEHSGDHIEGITALEAAGFRPQRVLLTMRRATVPADRRLEP